MSLLGIDVGTTGLKGVLIETETGRALGSAYREYPMVFQKPGWAQVDAELVWTAFGEVLREINAGEAARQDPAVAMSFSISCDEVVPLDSSKCPLDFCISSPDTRGAELLPIVRDRIGEIELFRVTGVPLHSMFPLVRLLWYRENRPDILRRTDKVLGWADFLIWRMGLPAVTDYSDAARWMAFDIRRCEWATQLFEALELPTHILPEARPSASVVGEVPASIAEDFGFGARRPLVVTGAIDQMCAALGAGMKKTGDGVVGTGTWEVLTTLVDDPPTDEAALRRGFAYSNFVTPDRYVGLAANASGGSLLRWFRDQFGQAERDTAERTGQDVYDLLLAEMPDEPSGLLLLPHFQGSHNPWMDPHSKGALLGLTWGTTRGQFLRAILEGITFELRANIEGLREAGSNFSVLRNTGGGSRSRAWRQLKADVLGLAIETVDVEEAGCLSAAVLAGVALGLYPSIAAAQDRFVKAGERTVPRPDRQARYDELYRTYRAVYPAVAPITHEL